MNLGDNIPLLHEGRFWSWIRIRAALELVRAKRAQEIFGAKGEFVGIELGHFGFRAPERAEPYCDWSGDREFTWSGELRGLIFRPPISARGRKYLMALPKPWE